MGPGTLSFLLPSCPPCPSLNPGLPRTKARRPVDTGTAKIQVRRRPVRSKISPPHPLIS